MEKDYTKIWNFIEPIQFYDILLTVKSRHK